MYWCRPRGSSNHLRHTLKDVLSVELHGDIAFFKIAAIWAPRKLQRNSTRILFADQYLRVAQSLCDWPA